jgi:Domain of unknown function (DUF5069)
VLRSACFVGHRTFHGHHFACPLDQMLFSFKGVQADDVRSQLASGATDEQLIDWLNKHGTPKTVDEIKEWGGVEAYRPYEDPERKEWFAEEAPSLASSLRARRFSTTWKPTTW